MLDNALEAVEEFSDTSLSLVSSAWVFKTRLETIKNKISLNNIKLPGIVQRWTYLWKASLERKFIIENQ